MKQFVKFLKTDERLSNLRKFHARIMIKLIKRADELVVTQIPQAIQASKKAVTDEDGPNRSEVVPEVATEREDLAPREDLAASWILLVEILQVTTRGIEPKFQSKNSNEKKRKKEMSTKVNCFGNSRESVILHFCTVSIILKSFFFLEIAKKYPPSLRLIVVESDTCEVGKLFVVTFKGGSLGREGSHEVLIPDMNISRTHLKFTYNHKKKVYQLVDRSRNGTLLNGVQLSSLTQEDSNPSDLDHGSFLQLSKTKLLCHVHEGLTTCNDCEPYNYLKKSAEEPKSAEVDPQPSNLSHKEQLKLLQKRYGLATEKYLENPTGTKNKNYEDRAEKRRFEIGSSHESVKTQQSSLNSSISSENKGFKLLSKMGWSEGKSIGKNQEGIKEPVQLRTQQGTSGLGCEVEMPSSFIENRRKKEILSKTQERYNSIKNTDENIFGDEDDD